MTKDNEMLTLQILTLAMVAAQLYITARVIQEGKRFSARFNRAMSAFSAAF